MKPTFVAAGPGAGTASLSLSLAGYPWLADHRFQHLTVLPGAFYLQAAVTVQRDCLGAPVATIKRAEFLRPVLLGDQELRLAVTVAPGEAGRTRYAFYEHAISGSAGPCATLEIEPAAPDAAGRGAMPPVPPPGPEAEADPLMLTGPQFYSRLEAKGNQYGARCQTLAWILPRAGEAWAKISTEPSLRQPPDDRLASLVLDAAVQALAVFQLDQPATFVLGSIAEIRIGAWDLSAAAWVQARPRPAPERAGKAQLGDVFLRDSSGACLVAFAGVELRALAEEAALPAPTEVRVAANFTAEPVADALRFWSDYLPWRLPVHFSPYNQIFQELLTPDGAFQHNRGGFNVILVNLAEWADPAPEAGLQPDAQRLAAALDGLPRHTLRPGWEVAHLNRHETEYVYREIFEDRCYLRHGIRLADDATVVDIGANIGLFSLFVRSQAARATVLAYEPNPDAFRALQANCAAYGPGLRPFNVGVGRERGVAPFTVYEKSSVFSSFHADREDDHRAIETVVTNLVRDQLGAPDAPVEGYVDELMADRLAGRTFDCPLLSVSDIVRDNGLQRIDLLKIDAEKSELEILRGIDAEIWPRIEQVVIEVHDQAGQTLAEIQRLLQRQGFRCAVDEEAHLAGSGLYNLYATRSDRPDLPPGGGRAAAAGASLLQALAAFPAPAQSTTFLCFCPWEQTGAIPSPQEDELHRLERDLGARARQLPHIRVIPSAAIRERYPASHFFDRYARELGHIPYSSEGFAAIATSLVRAFAEERRPLVKVLAVDCDHTLWQGICGEDGPLGVTVTAAHRALQEFILGRRDAGMLLCLCSKNNPEDVWAVFDRHPDMLLRREHFSAARISWAPKSQGLRQLAQELNVGLESIVLLDDSPQECAEVRAHSPEVAAITLPADSQRLRPFLDHLWLLDGSARTAEDSRRAQSIQEGRARQEFRHQTATLKDFIAGLQLQVELAELGPEARARAAQLTQRTNQFNFTTVRRTESELAHFLEEPGCRGLTAEVSDRFGDYGLVGLLLFRSRADRFQVDTFLLSCRALGRGVEHQMVAHLGREAVAAGKHLVELRFVRSGRNQPAWNFLRSIGGQVERPTPEGSVSELPAKELAALRYDPDQAAQVPDAPAAAGKAPAVARPPWTDKSEAIARDLATVAQITAAMVAAQESADPREAAAEASGNGSLTARLLRIWRTALGQPRLGPEDNFNDVGGTSLKAVQVIAAIHRELHLPATIVTLFECPTVRLLAQKLETGDTSGPALSAAQARGAGRLPPRSHRSPARDPVSVPIP